ncbi:MAG: hypothetical protein AAGA29_07995 [Planctomycetota bacterium]
MSMIQFSCPSCNTQYKVPEKAAGKQATCKSCNASMTVPTSSQSGGGGAAPAFADDVVAAPAMQAGSVFAPSSARRSGPSPVLLAGIGGGVLVLILAVVLIVVLTSGGGNQPAPNPNGTGAVADNTDSSASDRGRRRGRDRGTSSSTDDDEDADDEDTDGAASSGRVIDTPGPALAGVRDWSLGVPDKVANVSQSVDFRGMILNLPGDWEEDRRDIASLVSDNEDFKSALTETFGDEVLETAFLQAGPRESSVDVQFMVFVSRTVDHDEWPAIEEVERLSSSAEIDRSKLEDLREQAESGDFASGMLLAWVENMVDSNSGTPVAFNLFAPETFFIKQNTYDRVEFGTLFGGHPFARVVLTNEEDDTSVLLYTGFVNDLQVTFVGEAPSRYDELIADMDYVVRSSRLMSSREARAYGREDATYQMWVNDRFINVAYRGDSTPYSDVPEADWEGFPERSLFEGSTAARATVTPLNQPYGIVPPDGLSVASINRVSARWFPNDNGLWLQMKVTKLEGRAQRTMATPIMSPESEGGLERAFVNSTIITLPAGYEYSKLEAGEMTLHRVLLPEHPSSDIRKVYYVVFDGTSQVTVEAHFDKSRPEDLATLDASAQSLTKI